MRFYLEFVYLYYEKEIYLEVPRLRPDLVPSHPVFVPARLECTLKCSSRMNLGSSSRVGLDYGLGSSSSCKNPGLSSSSSRMSMYPEFGSYFDSIQGMVCSTFCKCCEEYISIFCSYTWRISHGSTLQQEPHGKRTANNFEGSGLFKKIFDLVLTRWVARQLENFKGGSISHDK